MGIDQTAVASAGAQPAMSTQEKALAINLDAGKFGTFAEIGAGQEVARWFFHVGHASATVAKSMSAYDMVISDILYGATDHYVSRARLESMLEREWNQLIERLDRLRGERTGFFVFADTVATRSRTRNQHGQGWMGIRFQTEPRAPYSQIIIHVNLLDEVPVSEQEALGILGVNLMYGAFHQQQPGELMQALMEGLSHLRVDIDMIKFSGAAYDKVDNRLACLQLVELGLTDSTMFTAQGEVVQPAEVLYKKPVLISRGRFRPITNVGIDMLSAAVDRFTKLPGVDHDPVVVMGLTLRDLDTGHGINGRDFLDRADMLGALGKTVMVSNFRRFDSVTSSFRRYSQNWIGYVMGVPTLRSVFDEQYYREYRAAFWKAWVAYSRATFACTSTPRATPRANWPPRPRWKWIRSFSTCWTTCARAAGSRPWRSAIRGTSTCCRTRCWRRFRAAQRDGSNTCPHPPRRSSSSASCLDIVKR